MVFEPGLVFAKTPKASLELGSRRYGLPPRQRQLLILFDGRRTLGELARFVPMPDLIAWTESLERDGYVARREGNAPPDAGGTTGAVLQDPAPDAVLSETLHELRNRLRRALLDMTGPHGDAMAIRIERAKTLEELRALRGPATAVVEAVQGREAAGLFAQRIGRW